MHYFGILKMNTEIIKNGILELSEKISFKYPAVGWYFSSDEIDNSFVFQKDKWVCMFMYLKLVLNKGKRIRFSDDNDKACTGPCEFFGFQELEDDDGRFLAEVERFKKNRELAREYYKESLETIHTPKEKYLYMERIEDIDDKKEIEVLNLFPDLPGLAKLTVLSNYDRERSFDNVLTPGASGCQSVFSMPYNEKFAEKPKSIIGLTDTHIRQFIPDDIIAFSVPVNRFIEMINNIEGSFLDKNFKNPTSF